MTLTLYIQTCNICAISRFHCTHYIIIYVGVFLRTAHAFVLLLSKTKTCLEWSSSPCNFGKISCFACAHDIQVDIIFPILDGYIVSCFQWQRCSFARKYIKKHLGENTVFKGTQLWTVRELMFWCRRHAYSPHYLGIICHMYLVNTLLVLREWIVFLLNFYSFELLLYKISTNLYL